MNIGKNCIAGSMSQTAHVQTLKTSKSAPSLMAKNSVPKLDKRKRHFT